MVRYTKESLEALRNRIDLVEVLQQHIDLKRAGASFKACCPFHDEKTPSFVVNRSDTHYHCFGCGAHGDAIQFLMQHLRVSFTEAIQQLAERFNVHLEQVEALAGPEVKKVNKLRLKEALDAACRFYQTYLLHTQEAKLAFEYLQKRKLSLDFIQDFRVGLSPHSEGLFRKYMHECHFRDEELVEAGLLTERGGRLREFFQDRIMFPILDVQGACIGFSARKYQEATYGGKYINTSETPLFKKSRVLFGLAQSRKRIIKGKQAIIVEGGLDALRLIYHGFDLTVAALGTAFGQEHAQELVALGVTRVNILFDGDTAGQEAAVKAGHFFQKRGVEVLVASLDKDQDPDSLLVKGGPAAIAEALFGAKDYMTFLVDHFSKGMRSNSPAEKNKLIQELTSRIREWDDAVMVHESLKKLAALTQVPEEVLGVGMGQPKTMAFKRNLSNTAQQAVDPDRILEQDLLRWLILCGPSTSELVEICTKNMTCDELRLQLAKMIYTSVTEMLLENKELDLLKLSSDIEADDMPLFLSEILSKKVNREKAREQLINTIQRIKERNWMLEREAIKMKIHSGKASEEELMELVKQFDELKKAPPALKSL